MRILTLTSSYPKFLGDSTAPFIESITTNIARLGHEVHLVLPEHRDWHRPSLEDGVHYHPYRYSPRPSWTPWGYAASLDRGVRVKKELVALAPLVMASALHTCRRLTSRIEFDLVHAHWVIPNGVIAARAAAARRIPLAISLHGSDVTLTERSRPIGAVSKNALRSADLVTAASTYVLERARSFGIEPDRLALLPYGVDTDRFRPDANAATVVRERLAVQSDEILVLGIGRLVEWKGFEYLLEAIAAARETDRRIKLSLVGDGDLRRTLEQRAGRLGLGECVTFVGAVAHEGVPAYFAAADIVAVPSIHHEAGFFEALGNVALEASASGKPVVASRVGGLPDVVRHMENGLLVADRDVSALAQAIRRLASDPELRIELGSSGRSAVEQSCSWQASAERFVDAFESLNRRRQQSPPALSHT